MSSLFQLVLLLQSTIALHGFLATSAFAAGDKHPDTANDSATSTRSIFNSVNGINVGGSLLAIAAILGGVAVCIAGVKLFRITLFAIGFVTCGTLLAICIESAFESKSWVLTASWVAFLVGGFLGGCIVTSIYSVGVFFTGAIAGIVLAALMNTSFGYKLYPSHPTAMLIILAVVFGLAGGVLAIRLEMPVVIVATSIVGAAVLVWGVGYFAGHFPTASDLTQYRQSSGDDWVYSIPSAWWVYLAGTILIACAGTVLQSKLTSKYVATTSGNNEGEDGEAASNRAAPRRHVVMFARRDHQLYDVDLGTPKTGDSRSEYAIAHV
uniref:Transmembrane protein 198 n=1 Tax=Globisporangium ultimum (strain ATCC 200006 / CBS 805.95 / DAOM BR144) TaxID=431595 RepID=K3W5A3_GLOUD